MESVHFKNIRGHRIDSTLLWVPAEQYLYYKKCTRNGKDEYECYQTILRKNGKNEHEVPYCTAGSVVKDGVLTHKLKGHTNHPDHSEIFKNLEARNNILERCIIMKSITEDLCVKVPDKEVFTHETAKLVTYMILLHFSIWAFLLCYCFNSCSVVVWYVHCIYCG